jgi:hypothetical protein
LVALPAYSSELRSNECQRWQDGRRVEAKIGVNEFTRERAESALQTLSSISLEGAESATSIRQIVQRESGYLLGYLLRTELLNARANNEHDADEFNDFCRHWSAVNFGTPDYKRAN